MTKIKFKESTKTPEPSLHSSGDVWEYTWLESHYYMLAIDILKSTWYLINLDSGWVDKVIQVDYSGDLRDEDFKKLWEESDLPLIRKRNVVEIITE
jgi:hypothetical protein